MLLTISTTHKPATDLGFLLHKHPQRRHTTELKFGEAHVFFPEANEDACTAALLIDVDPVGLVRKNTASGEVFGLQPYVNDRPYVASSFLSVALGQAFRTALTGRSKDRQDLADKCLPFDVHLPVLPCRGGEAVLRRLFEPLGYSVTATRLALDEAFPKWGDSAYFDVTMSVTARLSDMLKHLYVLMPVLDQDKHYWVGDDEVEKLLRHGAGWLDGHPEKELIARRYLKSFKSLMDLAMARLSDVPVEDEIVEAAPESVREDTLERQINLNQQRMDWVVEALKERGVKRVVDMGCGEGKLITMLSKDIAFEQITGCDVSVRALEIARERLNFDRLPEFQQQRISLLQSALTYRDKRLSGFDAATVIEVIEHLEPERLEAFSRVIFEFAKPGLIILTTPNAEYNALFENLPKGKFRHPDHRFEWNRSEFESWANETASRFGYRVEFAPIGTMDERLGAPTQAGIFVRL